MILHLFRAHRDLERRAIAAEAQTAQLRADLDAERTACLAEREWLTGLVEAERLRTDRAFDRALQSRGLSQAFGTISEADTVIDSTPPQTRLQQRAQDILDDDARLFASVKASLGATAEASSPAQ